MATREEFDKAVDQVVARAGGDDATLQQIARAFATNDAAAVRKALAEQGGLQVTEGQASAYIGEFHNKYKIDASGKAQT